MTHSPTLDNISIGSAAIMAVFGDFERAILRGPFRVAPAAGADRETERGQDMKSSHFQGFSKDGNDKGCENLQVPTALAEDFAYLYLQQRDWELLP